MVSRETYVYSVISCPFPFLLPTTPSLPPHLDSCIVSPSCSIDTLFSPSPVPADPKAHVGDGVHFHDFTFAPEAGVNFQ